MVYHFTYDTYGNNTSVSITSDSVVLKSSAVYTADGNRLASTTDTAGKVTTYSYNENTNVLEWVRLPGNTETTQTAYTYDSMYRLAKAQAEVSTGSTLTASYGYTNDLLTSITTGSTTYSFTYGAFALRSNIKIGSRTLATYSYTTRNNYLNTLAYGNGDSVQYTYNKQGQVTKQTYEDGDTVSYHYDNNGDLGAVIDSATGVTSQYYYDLSGRMVKYTESGTNYTHSVGYEYDSLNNLSVLSENINGTAYTTKYTYDKDNRVTALVRSNRAEYYTYDGFGHIKTRIAKNNGNKVLTDTLEYYASGRVKKLTSDATGYDVAYTYSYGAKGNITSVSDGTNTTSYTYDSAQQLIRENNQAAGKTWVWAYDDAGNITSKKEYAYTTGTLGTVQSTVNYVYGDTAWGDLLTEYGGRSIIYDNIGNPTSYYNGTHWTLTWEHGRELATISDGSTTWTNTYNADGLRTKRTNGTKTYSYVYCGDKLIHENISGNTLFFTYDISGSPLAVNYNGTNYYYATNLQGDVTAIVNTGGTAVVKYTYDAWGKLLSTTGSMAGTLGAHNPLRYRGYVYDVETGLYYLQSRYYDPQIGRFVNSDALVSTGQGLLGNNMFAYCRNNPVSRKDISGTADVDCYDNDPLDEEDMLKATQGGDNSSFDVQQAILDGDFSGSFSYGVPQKAWDVLNFLKSHNWHPPQNYKGGKPYENDGRDNSEKLPDYGAPYYEYDINPKVKGVDRGDERIVTNKNGMTWYTPTHYRSFIRME